MYISWLRLKNWRNFRIVDCELQERTFLIGPNASGKSNLLDVFRLLRDIAQPGGGLQQAMTDRGGITRIRCLAARRYPDIEIDVTISDNTSKEQTWRYSLGLRQEQRGNRLPMIVHERVWKNKVQLLGRPDKEDTDDPLRLTQTFLEQINANAPFRPLVRFFESICYLHLVPQLVRHPREFSGPGLSGDPFGRSFLEKIARTPERVRRSRLKKIQSALQVAVPQLSELRHVIDHKEGGTPHLEAVYEHWRPHGAIQREREFSDGTLRLIGLLWSLLEGDSLLLLEEPELSLNADIIRRLPSLFHRSLRQRRRQLLISTHSMDLLSDRGIGPEEVVLLTPTTEGTTVKSAASISEISHLLNSGMSIGEVVLPRTRPQNLGQLELWG